VPAVIVNPFLARHAPAVDVAAWCAVFSEGQHELSGSAPRPAALAKRLRTADDLAVRRWSARRGGAEPITGVAELRLQRHEPGVGYLRLFVAPAARRHGLGSALLGRAVREASGAGVGRLQGTVLASPSGEPFARTCTGLRVVLRLVGQDQRLDDPAVLSRCHQVTACPVPGYQLRHWRGEAPEALVASFGRVMGHVLDAPGAGQQLAARDWDRAAVRAWEAGMTAGGAQLLVCVAVHAASGQVAAATVTTVPAHGGRIADQHDTAVLPQHRRRGLARWIKADQTIRLHDDFPAVRAITVTVNQANPADAGGQPGTRLPPDPATPPGRGASRWRN
jgi:GNAT superfamily N-acetyltransferase